MEIIGNGFMARHLRPLGAAHPDAVVLAAGVPRQMLPEAEHQREVRLVRQTAERCLHEDRRLVFFSTASMYGAPGCRGREDDPIVASTRYGRHKLELENDIRSSGVRYLILRLAYVLGPDGPRFRLVPALIDQLRSGRVRIISGSRRDILYVADFVRILDALLATGGSSAVVNVASGDCADIADIVGYLEQHLGITAEREVVDVDSVSHCPSVEQLRSLVPESAGMGFGPGYHRRAIDRYLAATATGREPLPRR
jgi:NDP-hexose 4-ketoreductase